MCYNKNRSFPRVATQTAQHYDAVYYSIISNFRCQRFPEFFYLIGSRQVTVYR